MDHYLRLGVSRQASPNQLRQAFRRQAKLCHPDRGGSQAEMVALDWAYAVLADPEQRLIYDRALPPATQSSLPVAKLLSKSGQWLRLAGLWCLVASLLWLCHSPVDLPQRMLAYLR